MTMTAITLSEAGTKFICDNFELFRPKPYRDSGGLPTIGFGCRITEAQMLQWKDGITEQQALVMYQHYMDGLQNELRKLPLAGMEQCKNDAIFSLCYNIGFGQFVNSTIYKTLMTRGINLSPWLEYVRDQHGNVDEGLVRRRQMELRLFIWNIYN